MQTEQVQPKTKIDGRAAPSGGQGWQQRTKTHAEELGDLWAECGIVNEYAPLKSVLLHQPGPELIASIDPAAAQMLEPLDPDVAQSEHMNLADLYRAEGVEVNYVSPDVSEPSPNQMFCADLYAMTPEGAILGRTASVVRAGEERWVARRLSELGVPILRSLTGTAVFEGADLMWLNAETAVIGRGLRTNQAAISQIQSTLADIGVTCHAFDMPAGPNSMGVFRIVDKDFAIAWPRRTPQSLIDLARSEGYEVAFVPESEEIHDRMAFNFVTLSPKRILMVGGNPKTKAFYESLGVTVLDVDMNEVPKAAGAVGCLTGILSRK